MDIKEVRYTNARHLANLCGGVSAFGAKLNRSKSQASAIVGKNPNRNIGDRLAREIEEVFGKPTGWLDIPRNMTKSCDVELQADLIREAYLNSSKEMQDAMLRMLGVLQGHSSEAGKSDQE